MKNRRRSNVYGYNRPNPPDKRGGGALRVEITPPNSYQAYEGGLFFM
ncbi:hypothetical protein [Gracilibacillus sp. JCM 18860]